MVDIHESTEAVMDSYPVANMERQESSYNLCDTDSNKRPVMPFDQGCDPQNLFDSGDPTHEGKPVASISTQDTQHEIVVLDNNTSETSLSVSMVEDSLLSSLKPTPTITDLKSETKDQEAFKPCTSYKCIPSVLNSTSTSSKMANHENLDGLCMELSHSSESDVNVAETLKIDVGDVGHGKLSISSGVMDTSGTGVRLADGHGELTKRSRKSVSPVRENNVDMDAPLAERKGGSCRTPGKVHLKKARLGEISEQAHQVNVSIANDSLGCFFLKDSLIEGNSLNNFVEAKVSEDIMSIVQEDRHKSSTGLDKTAGIPRSKLRVKKIMRRVGDDAESIDLVQKLKNEIRDAVQKNPSNNLDEVDAIDKKLLAAFRAAIVKPKIDKVDHSQLPVKHMVLKRGKTRESLTKKIYGTAKGRRRAAWARDRDIEFWKRRCITQKPEKCEALKSVLDILKTLRSSPDKSGSKKELEVTAEKSILSRVYLADTSVFPRKENLKALSSLAEVSVGTNIDKNKGHKCSNSIDPNSHPSNAKNLVVSPRGNLPAAEQVVVCPGVCSKKESDCLKSREVVSSMKDHQKRFNIGDTAMLPASKGASFSSQPSNDVHGHSVSTTADKRKWAMDILARKNASTNTEKCVGKEEDHSILKNNFPLLAQLPLDMRPVLTVSRNTKVPLSTRQAQLYRLTEFYLQKVGLPVVCRSAAAELAVADAINVEQAILDKSISKSVFVNLCSQHIVASKHQKVEKLEPLHEAITVDDSKQDEKVESKQIETFSSAEEALKLTGLLSDSPPGSPAQPANSAEVDDSVKMHTQKGGSHRVPDAECNSEMDTYGAFDYSLDKACSISSSLSKVQNVSNSRSDDRDLELKVVFSALNDEKPDGILDSKEHLIMLIDVNDERTRSLNESNELEMRTEPVSMCRKAETGLQSNNLNNNPEPDLLGERSCEEIPLKECEELCAPDGKCLAESIPGKEPEAITGIVAHLESENNIKDDDTKSSDPDRKTLIEKKPEGDFSSEGEIAVSQTTVLTEGNLAYEKESTNSNKPASDVDNVFQKVEAYIKEHIRPLCKSRVITVEQYRWAVRKTVEKVMKYHCKAKNANFLIKEGGKVKKLAEQYVEAAQQKEWKQASN